MKCSLYYLKVHVCKKINYNVKHASENNDIILDDLEGDPRIYCPRR